MRDKILLTLKTFLNQLKTFSKKVTRKATPQKLPLEVLSKIPKRNKVSK